MAIHWRRQHLRWNALDALHACQFTTNPLAGRCRRLRRERQSLGESTKHRRGSDHDRQRADANTNAKCDTNCYCNCHTHSYSKSDSNTNGNSHCNAKPDRNTDCYCNAYSEAYPNTEGSCYAAASAESATKTVILPRPRCRWAWQRNAGLLLIDARPYGAKEFITGT